MKTLTCVIDGCVNPVKHRDWCGKHYTRWQRHGDPLKTLYPDSDRVACKFPDCGDFATRLTDYCPFHYKQVGAAHRIRERVDYVNALKLRLGCADCGYRKCVASLHFDHLPGTVKLFNIATGLYQASWKRILAEIEKCEVVCANCHGERTYSRRPEAIYAQIVAGA